MKKAGRRLHPRGRGGTMSAAPAGAVPIPLSPGKMPMRKRTLLWLTVALVALASGCAAPTEAQRAAAQVDRERLAVLVRDAAAAIRDDNVAGFLELVSPGLRASDALRLKLAVGQATWLMRYTGYEVDAEGAAAALGWRDLQGRYVAVEAEATNAAREQFVDRYLFVRADGGWLLDDVALQRPLEGDWLDPPPDKVPAIRKIVRPLLLSLKAGNPEEVYVALPRNDPSAQFRALRRSFWARLFGRPPENRLILDDLQLMHEVFVRAWPDPDGEIPLIYVTPALIAAVYELPYGSTGAGARGGPDVIRFYVFLAGTEAGWRLKRVRLVGEVIPFSE